MTIPDSVTGIGYEAFSRCSNLTSVTIGNSVNSIGDYAFLYCNNLESIEVDEGNSVYHSAGNCIIERATKTLVMGCKNSVIPSDGSVTGIGSYAFYGCSTLTGMTIPDSVTVIGASAFEGCIRLESVTIPYTVTSIGPGAFRYCSGMTIITLLNKDTMINDSEYTISDSATIHGYGGSTAQAYAEKYGRTFVALEEPEGVLGDVNGDTVVNSDDAVAILRHLAGYTVDGNIALGDYNSNGVTNSDDAVAILRMLAGYTD
jgi:hypothetical protein